MIIIKKSIKKIKNSEAFIALITNNFIKDENCMEECKEAEKHNKPMYAVVRDEEAWKKIEHKYLWRKDFPAEPGFEEKIEGDLEFLRVVNDAKNRRRPGIP